MGRVGRVCLKKISLQYGADLKSKLILMVNTRYLKALLELSRLTYCMYEMGQGNGHRIIKFYENK